jgi:ketosteroid isomerase-like protein
MNEATTTSQSVETVRRIYEAFARSDLDTVMEHCAPDAVVTQDSRLPWGGRYVGRDHIAEFAVKLVSATDSAVTSDEIFQAGHIWTLRDGLVVEAQFFIDSEAMLDALDQ